jgi:hypothetical protein
LADGIRAFSQYVRGETRQGKTLDKLLRLLDRHSDLLDEIRVKVAAWKWDWQNEKARLARAYCLEFLYFSIDK